MTKFNFKLSSKNLIFIALALIFAGLIFLWPGSHPATLRADTNIFKEWDCGDGLSGCTSEECSAHVVLFNSGVDLYFNVPTAGRYNCTVNVLENNYGYHDHDQAAPQQQEYSDVSVNGVNFGTTNDYACNTLGYGFACLECDDFETSFSRQLDLSAGTNTVSIYGYQSHGLRQVQISCQPLEPPTPQCLPIDFNQLLRPQG
ncbi:MAG: hypothetical protein COU85_02175 [Candidatus Portnoybacteria bacterium CG10_big_fil_rev_8_21_14_0_10_44_7]|uniref:Uncharacterized protein n=1 Tax=Candidatus Portnoybacteria bacterium CG10_big_fil_rev_8_21_14_0_10_44_7 TaxID=1974816 RepID=A0A2M8KIH6_9BACT|nr:MAG: hypothetical protein COU85_02175 [Candidatus Portnoybacteria bacterium CG10_big_fil_rev_8_21_14_0_10_44_7]